MLQSGRVVFSQMEQVLFGIPAAQAVAELAQDAQRVFLMVSGTLNRQTDEIEKVRRALGNRCVGTFDRMPPHTPRSAVIAAAEQARGLGADLIVTVGGGSITDGAKAVQLCLANDIRTPEAIDTLRPVDGSNTFFFFFFFYLVYSFVRALLRRETGRQGDKEKDGVRLSSLSLSPCLRVSLSDPFRAPSSSSWMLRRRPDPCPRLGPARTPSAFVAGGRTGSATWAG